MENATHGLTDERLAEIRRRIPEVPREDMCNTERDRADLVAELDRMRVREAWLNGWPRAYEGDVLLGCAAHCVGCGRWRGVTTVAYDDGWVKPEKDPVWPFDEADCPVCWYRDNWQPRPEPEPEWPRGKRRPLP